MIAQSFSQAATHYDAHAFLQKDVGERLLERLNWTAIQPKKILDVGCGTGQLTQILKKTYTSAKVTGLDIAEGMIQIAKKNKPFMAGYDFICADVDELPYEDNSIDLIFSNLTFQWLPDISKTFTELYRVLKPNGLLHYTTLGPDTLKELKFAWQQADDKVHVNQFIDLHDLGDLMAKQGFDQPVMDAEWINLHYKTVKGLMRDLKGIGAHNMNSGRSKSLMGKVHWRNMLAAYETLRNESGYLPATYEVIYGHAWKPKEKSSTTENHVPTYTIRSLD